MATLGVPACARLHTTPTTSSRRRAHRAPAALAAAGLVATSVGLVAGSGTASAAEDGSATQLGATGGATTGLPDSLGRDLFFPFDDVTADGQPVLEALGEADVVATVSAAGGGEVLAGPDRWASGHSLRFEPFAPDGTATPAVVVVRPAAGAPDSTEPGGAPFSFGAEFTVDTLTGTSPTDNGDNLVQRGLFGAAAQYKIQLDDNRPSCRVAGSEGAVQVHAAERVEPGQWYRVRCRRVGDQVLLRLVTSVDGDKQVWEYAESGRTGTLSYGPGDSPFSIGGKVDEDGDVLAGDSDQFNGLVDDVFFRSAG